MTEVVIPGKVMLSGEYAVLHGAAAVLVPVPCELIIREIDSPPVQPYPRTVETALTQPVAILNEYEREHGLPHLEIDSSAFRAPDSGGTLRKLGLGSSAAEAVGVIALRHLRAGVDWRKRCSEIAFHAEAAHHTAQGGLGSGADVAVCAYGRPILFRRHEGGFTVKEIDLPDAAARSKLTLAWTGVPADTRSMVEAFERWVDGGERARSMVRALCEAGDNLAKAWFGEPEEEFFPLFDAFVERLASCTGAAGIDYRLDLHREIEEWARSYGGRAKPTGAGGGDMILLVGDLPFDKLDMRLFPL